MALIRNLADARLGDLADALDAPRLSHSPLDASTSLVSAMRLGAEVTRSVLTNTAPGIGYDAAFIGGKDSVVALEPQYYQDTTSGTAASGKVILDWDQAAEQLTRLSTTWSANLGQAVTVTYAYRATDPGAAIMPGDSGGFSQFNAAQIQFTEIALQLWADIANITFVRVGSGTEGPNAYSDSAAMLFANFETGLAGSTGWGYYPWPGATGDLEVQGDVWISLAYAENTAPVYGGYGPHLFVHEIGHAIGLQHPGDYDSTSGQPITYANSAEYWQDSRAYTSMSYFGSGVVGHALGNFSAGPMLHDIAAAQRLYGANMTTRTGDTTYGFNSNTGLQFFTVTSTADRPIFAVWDAGGIDTFDFSIYTTAMELDLRAEAFSSVGAGSGGVGMAIGNISIARGVVIENAIGGSGNDTIIGNAAANTLTGNAGNDILVGGDGADTLLGGDGNDVIYWDTADNPANVLGGDGVDTLAFTSGTAPWTFDLVAHGFENAEGRFTDSGANPWATRTHYFDSVWRLDRSAQVNDDGTSESTDYDQLSANTWSSFWQRFDTLARVTESVLLYDNGFRDSVNHDAPNAFNWTTFYWQDDSLARRTESVLIYDDGSTDSSNFDAADAFNWTQFWWKEDTAERRTEAVLVYDDGGRDSNNYDAVDAFDWTEFFWKEDSAQRRIESVLIYDDASRDSRNYDALDAFDWADFWWREDTLGRRTEDVLTYDDNSRDTVDYDETASFTWASIWRHYDPSGTLTQTITTYDDGSIVIG